MPSIRAGTTRSIGLGWHWRLTAGRCRGAVPVIEFQQHEYHMHASFHTYTHARGKHSGRDAPKMFQTHQKMAGSIVVWVSLGRTESHQHKEEGNVHWCRENAGDSPE